MVISSLKGKKMSVQKLNKVMEPQNHNIKFILFHLDLIFLIFKNYYYFTHEPLCLFSV